MRVRWPSPCNGQGEIQETATMNVSVRYILAAICFAVAALGFVLLPTGAGARTPSSRGCDVSCKPPPMRPALHAAGAGTQAN